jgi:glyoxylate reductase
MSWKVLITASGFRRTGQLAQEQLRQAGCELVFSSKAGPLAAAALAPWLADTDAVLASLDEFSTSLMSSPAAANLKLISRWGVGYDSIDVPAATRQGIVVAYTPGQLDDAVADYAFALLLALARRVCESHAAMTRFEWQAAWGTDVAGKTLGLVGCGRIGLAVARRARGFNMRVIAFNPRPRPEAEQLGVRFVPLDTLLAESDFVSLHAALTPQTRGLLGAVELGKMKPTAYLVNTARGALVDEAALVGALRQNRLAGAALDVFVTEPLPSDSPLRTAPNLLLSPHQASSAVETGQRISASAAQAILDLMHGRRPKNVVNLEVFTSPSLRAAIRTAP